MNRLLEATSCKGKPDELACLQDVPHDDLMNALVFVPRGVVDGSTSRNPVLPDAPEVLMATGQFAKVILFYLTHQLLCIVLVNL